MRYPRLLIGALVLLAGLVARAADTGEVSMSTLQSLPVLTVTVRGVSPDGEALGLTEEKLIETVRATLAEAGVKVIAAALNEKTPGRPSLEIAANVNKVGAKSCLYVLQLQLREDTKLVRRTKNLVDVPAITWDVQKTGVSSSPEKVTAELTKLAEKFRDEWLPANRP